MRRGEVNFRDEKTLLGFGQPQVRTETSIRTTATFFVFAYALLLLALAEVVEASILPGLETATGGALGGLVAEAVQVTGTITAMDAGKGTATLPPTSTLP